MKKYLINRSCNLKKNFTRLYTVSYVKNNQRRQTR